MRLFDRFLRTISSVLPSGLSVKETKLLAQLNPRRIYVENVRSLLGVSRSEAVRILETAVRQGVFERRIEVMCPDGTVAASAESEESLPTTVPCYANDEDGYPEETSVPSRTLRKAVFYRLYERSQHTVQRTA
jgi:hypothetical protein